MSPLSVFRIKKGSQYQGQLPNLEYLKKLTLWITWFVRAGEKDVSYVCGR